MPKDLFAAAAAGLACAAANNSQKKRYEEIQKELKKYDLKAYGPATESGRKAMEAAHPDEPLGYLYPNRMSTETWKQYCTKSQWLYRVQNPSIYGIYLFGDRDIMGWNPEWGDICEEYEKWCNIMIIPEEKRHLRSFFANPPHIQTTEEIIEERKKKEANDAPLAILGLLAIFVFILLVFASMG